MHLLLHFNEAHMNSQFEHWNVDKTKGWIQITQIQFDLETIQKVIFPGFQPRTKNGIVWKPRLPVFCLMRPDFESMKRKAKQQTQIEADFNIAFALSQSQEEQADTVSSLPYPSFKSK